jgi:hypothetical protein
MAIFPGTAIQPAGGGYTIDQSLRFNDDDSAYLSRTPASAGDRKTWTWSGWVKLGNIPSNDTLFSAKTNTAQIWLAGTTGQLRIEQYNGAGGYNFRYDYEGFIRDPSAWYHLVVAFDTANATEANRIKVYVNGIQRQISYTYNSMSQNFESEFNNSETHWLGTLGSQYFDGYMAEVHFIDGQALDPSYFGETDATYGHWKPIAYEGTYGTNGFYLDFSNSGSIGEDQAGSNDWTANNLAATDVVLDSPTNNFATFNPIAKDSSVTLKQGNLETVFTDNRGVLTTFAIPQTGKWYFEGMPTGTSDYNAYIQTQIGIMSVDNWNGTDDVGSGLSYTYDGNKVNNFGASAYGATYTTNDVIGVAVDMDAGTLTFYKNGSSQGTAFSSGVSGINWCGSVAQRNAYGWVVNFGQDSSFAGNKTAQGNTDSNGYGDFYYPVPSGFLSLCSANLNDPAVVPGENFNTVLWAGNGSTQSITGVGFQPDLVYLSGRNFTHNLLLVDSLRGSGTYFLYSNDTSAENTSNQQLVTSLDSDGFTVGNNGGSNGSGYNYVGWNWKADNTSGSTNTDGSITSTVAANTAAGFSIATYTGNGSSGQTFGHGLSQAPDMVIIKARSIDQVWNVSFQDIADGNTILQLQSTSATVTGGNIEIAKNASTIGIGSATQVNTSGATFIAYCFHSVDGFSKFGSYEGNGSSDGPFIYTGFSPAFVMVKPIDGTGDWQMLDSKREGINPNQHRLFANLSDQEYANSVYNIDVLSNGFKLRTSASYLNSNTIIYMAFAEYPFKFTNAR